MRAVRTCADLLGEDVLRQSYHSPVVRLNDLAPDVFTREDPLRGIDFDIRRQLGRLQRLESYLGEFSPPSTFFSNIMYGSLDAELLYSLVRENRPRTVLELGSGSTSLVISAALAKNAADGCRDARYDIVDPFPSPLLDGVPLINSTRQVSANEVPLSEFAGLCNGDILFIDTTHTVKVGSEVNYLVLEVLPALAPGVIVHFHDVFLPFSYPRAYVAKHLFYVEQYLIQAFLAYNPGYDVLFAAHALARLAPAEISAMVPDFARHSLPDGPSSFWIQRAGPTAMSDGESANGGFQTS